MSNLSQPHIRTRALVQARMSSNRLPGKMLKHLHGVPLVDHVLRAAADAVGTDNVLLLTSVADSDDPLAAHVEEQGFSIFRGDLDDVFGRFQAALQLYPSDWFFRICGDSPFLDPDILTAALSHSEDASNPDIITNIFPRTFPSGQSVELLKTETFLGIDPDNLTAAQHEHVTQVYYETPDQFSILNISACKPLNRAEGLAVDTPADLDRLEAMRAKPRFGSYLPTNNEIPHA